MSHLAVKTVQPSVQLVERAVRKQARKNSLLSPLSRLRYDNRKLVYFLVKSSRLHVLSFIIRFEEVGKFGPNRIFSPYLFRFWNKVSRPWYLLLSSCIDAPPPPHSSSMRNLHTYIGISIARLRAYVSMQSGGLKELSREIKKFVGPVRLAHLLETDNKFISRISLSVYFRFSGIRTTKHNLNFDTFYLMKCPY
jgi:hypothetical protein